MKFFSKKILARSLAVLLSISSIFVSKSNADGIEVTRVSGKNRYETPISISNSFFDTSSKAVIASGEGFADALVGGSLVSQERIPMFLCTKNSISNDVITQLMRLNTKRVYILGGMNTVSQSVENELKSKGFSVKRLAGKDRFETAWKIANERFELNSKKGDSMGDLYVAVDAYNYADALVAGALVGQIRNTTPEYIYPYVKNQEVGFDIAFGGYNSIPKNVDVVKRISGKDRFSTSVEAAKQFSSLTGKQLSTIVLVNGKNYPDALAASGICGKLDATIITTDPKNISDEAMNFIKSNGIKKVIIVGGENSVSTDVENKIKNSDIDLNNGWKDEDGNRYYYEKGNKVIGWKNIDGNKYFFSNDGKMKTGWMISTVTVNKKSIDNGRYYFKSTGQLEDKEILLDGWNVDKNGIGSMSEETAKKNVIAYIKDKEPSFYAKLNEKKLVIFSNTSEDGIFMNLYLSSPEDYWKVPLNGGYKEGSNNILKTITINLYNGDIK